MIKYMCTKIFAVIFKKNKLIFLQIHTDHNKFIKSNNVTGFSCIPNVSQALTLFDGQLFSSNKKEDALEHCPIINAILF